MDTARYKMVDPGQVDRAAGLHGVPRIRSSRWMGTQTSRINTLRGFCWEFGLAIPQGARTGIAAMSRALADLHSAVPLLIQETMKLLIEEIHLFELRIVQLEKELTTLARQSPTSSPSPSSVCAFGHGHARRHRQDDGSFQGCPPFRQLVRTDPERVFFGLYA